MLSYWLEVAKIGFRGALAGILLAGVILASGPAHAEEVTLQHKGLTALGTLQLAEGKTLADGVLLILHGTLAHKDMEIIAMLREFMAEREISTLTISLTLGLSNRTGMYDCAVTHTHRHMDSVDEVAAWVGWLKKKGAGDIWVAGHSRGANQIGIYVADNPDAAVKKAILIAPRVSDAADSLAVSGGTDKVELTPILEKAKKLIAEGRGDTVMKGVGLLYCPDADVTAASFVGYYGSDLRINTARLIPDLKRPTLFVTGSADTVNPGGAKAVAPAVDDKKISLVEVDGAGHFFRDLFGEELADAMAAFIDQ